MTAADRRHRAYRSRCLDRFGIRLSSHTIGTIGEMIVAGELLKEGWEVFRSVSPHSGCDLIVRRLGKSFAIEVRSGKQNVNGRVCYPQPMRRKSWDCIAVVLPDNSIHYYPPLPGQRKAA